MRPLRLADIGRHRHQTRRARFKGQEEHRGRVSDAAVSRGRSQSRPEPVEMLRLSCGRACVVWPSVIGCAKRAKGMVYLKILSNKVNVVVKGDVEEGKHDAHNSSWDVKTIGRCLLK